MSTITSFQTNWKEFYSEVIDEWDRLQHEARISSCDVTEKGLAQFRLRGYSGWLQITPRSNVNIHYKEGVEKPEHLLQTFLNIFSTEIVWFIPKHPPLDDDTVFQKRKIHTDELKTRAVNPWLNYLNRTTQLLLQKDEFDVTLFFEPIDQDLLQDLRLHMTPDVFNLQDQLDELTLVIIEQREVIMKRVDQNIRTTFKDLSLELSDNWGTDNVVHQNLSHLVFKWALYWDTDQDKYKQDYSTFVDNSRIENDGYWVSQTGYIKLVLDKSGNIQLADTTYSKDTLKLMIDNKIQSLRREIESSTYSDDIGKLVELHERGELITSRLRSLLEDYLHVVTFPGSCKYIND